MPKIVLLVPEGLLLDVWSSVGLWARLVLGPNFSLCDELGWVALRKLDQRTTLCATQRYGVSRKRSKEGVPVWCTIPTSFRTFITGRLSSCTDDDRL